MGFDSARRSRPYRVALGGGGVLFLATIALSNCIIDDDEKCGEGQVYVEQDNSGLSSAMCVCAPGSTPTEDGKGCIRCGRNESVQMGKCACKPGFAKTSEDGDCEKAAVGTACTADADCSEPFAHCATDGAAKYCTAKDCTATSCPTGYTCQPSASPSFCEKLPEGLGASCMSNDDCTGGAKYCETMQSKTCIIAGCASGDVKCPGSFGCCDLNSLLPGFSVCTPPASLPDGKCAYGTLVKP